MFEKQPAPRIFAKYNSEIWVPVVPEAEEIASAYPEIKVRRVFSPYPRARWADERQNFKRSKYSPMVCAYSGQQTTELEKVLTERGFSVFKLRAFKRIIEDWHFYLNELKGKEK